MNKNKTKQTPMKTILPLNRDVALKGLYTALQHAQDAAGSVVWSANLLCAWHDLRVAYGEFSRQGTYQAGEAALLAAIVLVLAEMPQPDTLPDDGDIREIAKDIAAEYHPLVDDLFAYAANHEQPIGSLGAALWSWNPDDKGPNERLLRQGVKQIWGRLVLIMYTSTIELKLFPDGLSEQAMLAVLKGIQKRLITNLGLPRDVVSVVQVLLYIADTSSTLDADDLELAERLASPAENDVVAAAILFDIETTKTESAPAKRGRFERGPGRFKNRSDGCDPFFTHVVISQCEREVVQAETDYKVQENENRVRALQAHTLGGPLGQARLTAATIRRNLDGNPEMAKLNTTKLDAVFGLLENLIESHSLLMYDKDHFLQVWDSERHGSLSLRLVLLTALQQAISRWVSRNFESGRQLDRSACRAEVFDFSVKPLTTEEEGTSFLSDWPAPYRHVEIDLAQLPPLLVTPKGMRFCLIYSVMYEILMNALKYEDGREPIRLQACIEHDFLAIRLTNSVGGTPNAVSSGSQGGLNLVHALMVKLASKGASFTSGHKLSTLHWEAALILPLSLFE